MHNKVIIIDDRIVVTGSYNFTYFAENRNDENVLIIHSPEIARIVPNRVPGFVRSKSVIHQKIKRWYIKVSGYKEILQLFNPLAEKEPGKILIEVNSLPLSE